MEGGQSTPIEFRRSTSTHTQITSRFAVVSHPEEDRWKLISSNMVRNIWKIFVSVGLNVARCTLDYAVIMCQLLLAVTILRLIARRATFNVAGTYS